MIDPTTFFTVMVALAIFSIVKALTRAVFDRLWPTR